eukprot:1847049-Alexandrium_andersonii.AAC.1
MQQTPQRRSLVPEEVPHVLGQGARRHFPSRGSAPCPIIAHRLGEGGTTLNVPRRMQQWHATIVLESHVERQAGRPDTVEEGQEDHPAGAGRRRGGGAGGPDAGRGVRGVRQGDAEPGAIL